MILNSIFGGRVKAHDSLLWSITVEKIEEFIVKTKQVLTLDKNESEAHRILGALYLTNNNYDLSDYHYKQA
ncbi:MAG: hypothetical protein GQ550_08085 [Gammaproteobacteria bacterium]|nr:hypothetical protein [Gammaproteobacteria bacterium]